MFHSFNFAERAPERVEQRVLLLLVPVPQGEVQPAPLHGLHALRHGRRRRLQEDHGRHHPQMRPAGLEEEFKTTIRYVLSKSYLWILKPIIAYEYLKNGL